MSGLVLDIAHAFILTHFNTHMMQCTLWNHFYFCFVFTHSVYVKPVCKFPLESSYLVNQISSALVMFTFALQLSTREKAPFLLTAAQITALLDSNPKLQLSFSFFSCVVLSGSLGLGFHRKPIVFCVKQSLLSHAATLRCCSALTGSLFPFFFSISLDISLLS